MSPWALSRTDDSVYRLLDAQARHVGNIKRIGGQWKLKAIGYDELGRVIPGGGPLTERHNTLFASLDSAEIDRQLAGA
jgi:hypothetical protein